MTENTRLEVWLRGPFADVPFVLQPVAHTLLQAQEEVNELTVGFPEKLLWERPGPVATVGFHLQHLTGVLDRLFTYARGESLSTNQLQTLAKENEPIVTELSLKQLLQDFNRQIGQALDQLKTTEPNQLAEVRAVGRARIPSTMLGLLFHAAEHTQRHVGQMLVTVRILNNL